MAELDDVAEREGVELRVGHWDDVTDAEAAVRSGRLDAVLDGDELVGDDAVPATLTRLVQNALIRVRITAALEGGARAPPRSRPCCTNLRSTVRTLEPQDPEREENAGIAFIAVLLAYGQLFGYGVWVATGVIEEKASRVVEILLSAIRPRQLLAGKIAGIGLLGIVQLAFIAAFAIGLSVVTGALAIPATAIGIALVVLVWFVMGFAFYAGLFAVSGSLVSRMEELQNAMVPINLIIFISFFISIGALEPRLAAVGDRVGVAVLVGARDARPHRLGVGDGAPGGALGRAPRGRHGRADSAVGPPLRGRGAEDRHPREAPRRVALRPHDRRRGLTSWRRPGGRARTCGTPSPCCAREEPGRHGLR